jgi:XTP/dITP diphosphohydrolase
VKTLIGTANAGKAREFREMLDDAQAQWLSLADLPDAPAVEETGATFRENACLKAAAYARHFGTWALADDSGLAVDALEGRPGVTSARWAEMHNAGKGDADNNALLLRQLEHVSDAQRTARFVCVLALADQQGKVILTASDTVEGRIVRESAGSNGFGYDPLFHVDELGRTTAQLDPQQKHAISHRGKALRRLRHLMQRTALLRAETVDTTRLHTARETL